MSEKRIKHALLISFMLTIAGKHELSKVKKASKNCRKASEKTLRGILEYAKNTEWGKLHNFSDILKAKNDTELYELWRKNISPQNYEDFRPFVERHKNGEENILFPGKPMMYATTSGTTKEPKWIPVTKKYYHTIYNKMTKLWFYTFIMHRPKSWYGKTLSIVGKAVEGCAPDGTVYGSVSGVTRRDIPEFTKEIYSEPAEVYDIKDYTARYYTLMRIGIEQDIHVIITANPSTIVEMQNNVNQFFDDYCVDIEKGILSNKIDVEPEIRDVIEEVLKPNPERAAELRKLKKKYGNVKPKHYWPNLQMLTTWKCGNTKVYIEKFKNTFPENCLYQEFSYFSSECRAGLVLNGKEDTVLFPHFHFFEFVDIEELDKEEKHFLELYELKQGKRYSVYITTYAGLYRYNMNDMIEVTGFYGTIPTIQFIQKINGIISMTGEKLHERQFIEAVQMAEKITGIKTRFFVGFADVQASVYHIYYEFENENISEKQVLDFNKEVDLQLKKENMEYETKRDSLRIKEPVPHVLQDNSFEIFKENCIKAGSRDGQFKLNLLMQDEKRHSMFKELIRK